MIFLYTYLFLFSLYVCFIGQAHNYIGLKKILSKDTKIVCNKYAIKVFLLYFFYEKYFTAFCCSLYIKTEVSLCVNSIISLF